MEVTVIQGESRGHYFTIHKTGCRDIARARRDDVWPSMSVESRQDIAFDIWSDHIGEGSMTEDDAMLDDNTHFAPCCKKLTLKSQR